MKTRFKIFASYNIFQYLCYFIHVLIFVIVSKCRKSPKLTNIVISLLHSESEVRGQVNPAHEMSHVMQPVSFSKSTGSSVSNDRLSLFVDCYFLQFKAFHVVLCTHLPRECSNQCWTGVILSYSIPFAYMY